MMLVKTPTSAVKVLADKTKKKNAKGVLKEQYITVAVKQNGVVMQIYCVLIAQLLMVVIRKKAATKKSFANMITVIRLHLMSYVELLEFIKDTYKAWRKTNNAPFAFAT